MTKISELKGKTISDVKLSEDEVFVNFLDEKGEVFMKIEPCYINGPDGEPLEDDLFEEDQAED